MTMLRAGIWQDMFTLPGMADIYQGAKALYLSAVNSKIMGQLHTTISLIVTSHSQELHQGQQQETEGVRLQSRGQQLGQGGEGCRRRWDNI